MTKEQPLTRFEDFEDKTIGQMHLLRKQGLSLRQIGAEVGFSHGYVGRVLRSQGIDQPPKGLKPSIPRRPQIGQTTLPDFRLVSDYEARGLTVKDAWRDYAKGCPKPYVYTHFSTLYRKWLDEQSDQNSVQQTGDDGWGSLDEYSADEDHLAELLWKRRLEPRCAVHVLSGFNCSLKVRNDELVSFDTGEERSFPKVTHGLQATVFMGEGGSITIDAVKWCEAQAVAICVIDWHGELVSVTTPQATSDVTIRRAQFAADRVAVAKAILRQKLASQRQIGKLSPHSYRSALSEIKAVRAVDEVVKIEGRMALEYWSNWSFELRHKKRNWPQQWTLF